MPRVILVEDSPTVREALARVLRAEGYEVDLAADGVTGAEMALARPPHVVLTDLWMPGMSGVQLCRLIKSEPATSHVPVILVTSAQGRRTRFWARSAGAAAYVNKSDREELLHCLKGVLKKVQTFPPEAPGEKAVGAVHERLSRRLDEALFESVVAGEVRSLAQREASAERVFTGLAGLVSDVTAYRWMGLTMAHEGRLLLHTHPTSRETSETEARATLAVRADSTTFAVIDERAVVEERGLTGKPLQPLVAPVTFGHLTVGSLAMSTAGQAVASDDEKLVSLVARELSGPMRIVALLDQMRTAAMSDPLTGLMNRRAFVDALERELARSKRYGHSLSVLLLDLDHFKAVNDTRGHGGGDAVLRGIAVVLRRMARKSDLVGRWGGEEFVVGLAQTPEQGARVAAERLRAAIADALHAMPEGDPLTVTASIGIATLGPDDTLERLVARADEAMYAAKQAGRNRVEVARAAAPPSVK